MSCLSCKNISHNVEHETNKSSKTDEARTRTHKAPVQEQPKPQIVAVLLEKKKLIIDKTVLTLNKGKCKGKSETMMLRENKRKHKGKSGE